MTEYMEQLNELNERLEAGMSLVEEKESAIKEYADMLNTYKSAHGFVGNVLKHYQTTTNLEKLNPKSAPLFLAQLFYEHKEGIVSFYNELREKIGEKGLSIGNGLKIGKDYFQAIAPTIEKSFRNIGYLFGLYFEETRELLGGSKLFDNMMTEYGSLVK